MHSIPQNSSCTATCLLSNKLSKTNYMLSITTEVRFGLIWFYGTSTIVGYLMPNLFLYIITVLFQTIQFSINIIFIYTQFYFKQFFLHKYLIQMLKQFYFRQFSISTQFWCQKAVLFQTIQFIISPQFSSIWSIRRYIIRAKVDLRAMAMKGYATFLKAPVLLEPHHQDCLGS